MRQPRWWLGQRAGYGRAMSPPPSEPPPVAAAPAIAVAMPQGVELGKELRRPSDGVESIEL